MWRKNIKEEWGHKCAYCGSEENLTIDHIVPQSKGGLDTTNNVVCCCKSCNHDKGHTPWEEWYFSQDFFTVERKNAIVSWMNENKVKNLHTYRQRKNICY